MTRKTISLLMAFIIMFSMAVPATAYSIDNDYDYVGHWAEDTIRSLLDNGYVTGYTDGSYKPEEFITRAEFTKVINNLFSYKETDENKTIKILCIGNSFSQDATQYIYDIAQSAGVTVIIGNLYSSGCSLERHWKNAESNYSAYTYYKWTSPDMQTTENQTIKAAVLDEKWDFITFQQFSGDSGFYSTFQPYLNELTGYVKKLSPNSKLALNMTWAYASDSTHEYFASYRNNQKSMYYSIVDAYNQAIIGTDIDIIIPCGTAIQNARTNPYLNAVDDDLTRDGFHLNTGIGRYIAGLTFFQTLIVNQESINKDLFTDVSFIPDTTDSNEDLAYLAKIAVMDAVKNPFRITYDKTEAANLDLTYVTHFSIPIDPLFFTGIKLRKASK